MLISLRIRRCRRDPRPGKPCTALSPAHTPQLPALGGGLSETEGLPPASNMDREVRRAGPKELYTPLGQC